MRDRATLLRVREAGRRGRSGPVTVRYLPVAGEDRCLVAYAIGKRTGTAVVRNRIRRRLRPLVDELALTGTLPSGALLVSAAAPVAAAPFDDVRRHLGQAVARAVGADRP
ncbi:MAG: ribonuclease P protein component [Acidimicrobiales bacterium]|nr:ribonuclease P protein component [Acidimicrobiales bacterium]